MIRYTRILSAVAGSPWAIHPEKGRAVIEFLAFAALGGQRSADEVAAIAADRRPDANATQIVAGYGAATSDGAPPAPGSAIAVIGLKGVISPRASDEMDASGPGGTSAEGFTRRLRAAIDDPRVGGIVIDGDSPGGSVFGVHEAFNALVAVRGIKPIVAVANSFIASAAYWIAAGADEIVVTPSGEVGSIGVLAYHEDLSKALADKGVTPTLIRSSNAPAKAKRHPAFPLGDDARADMQASVDRYEGMFLADIAAGRGRAVGDVIARFGGGRMVGAEEAVASGLADRVATLDAEIARMADRLAAKAPAKSDRRAATADRRRRLAIA